MKWLIAFMVLCLVFVAAMTDSYFIPWLMAVFVAGLLVDRWIRRAF